MNEPPPAQDARLFLDANMQQAESLAVAGGAVAVFSSRSPARQTANEDAAAVFPIDHQSAVLVVADGVGGETAGERASALAMTELDKSLKSVGDGPLLRTAILNGIENANRAVSALGIGAGTTLAAVEIQDGQVRPYHVGDSMILVVGQRGKVKLQTVSHSPVGYAVEAGVLDEAEAMHHEDRHLVSNVIGMPDMRIEIGGTVRLAARDTVLLASDGLIDNLYPHEIIEHVRKGPLSKAVDRLVALCQQRMNETALGVPSKPDDLTLAIFRRGR